MGKVCILSFMMLVVFFSAPSLIESAIHSVSPIYIDASSFSKTPTEILYLHEKYFSYLSAVRTLTQSLETHLLATTHQESEGRKDVSSPLVSI